MESPDEKRVKSYLEERQFVPKRFSKAETRGGKTPDFCVSRNGELLFYCEVKSILEDGWLDKQLSRAAPDELAGGSRNDPILNRLAADIHEAVKQFDAVNKDQKYPNVLVFVNHDDMCDFDDLIAILTGNFYGNDGTASPIFWKFSEGRIKEQKEKIHLFIWIDEHKPDQRLFSQANDNLHAKLCVMFDIDQKRIDKESMGSDSELFPLHPAPMRWLGDTYRFRGKYPVRLPSALKKFTPPSGLVTI